MSKGAILLVEDDSDISNLLDHYFVQHGYQVQTVANGQEVMKHVRKQNPDIVILDIHLPGMDGHEVFRQLRTTIQTKHIPIIFLTEHGERNIKLDTFKLGADDFITKPFDIEELYFRVQSAIETANRIKQIDPVSNKPSKPLIEEYLRQLMSSAKDWIYIDIQIRNFEAFNEMYSWSAGDEVIRAITLMIMEGLEAHGTSEDFTGYVGGNSFVVITHVNNPRPFLTELSKRFDKEIPYHYSFIDRERAYMLLDTGEKRPLMSLVWGLVSNRTHEFGDIREIIEVAAEDRRWRERNRAND